MNGVNLRHHFTYDPATGRLEWTDAPGRRPGYAGVEAGCVRSDGRYRTVHVGGTRLYVHRIAWALSFGRIPEGLVIDHINGNGLDNRLGNLRLVTRSLNQRNRKRSVTNKTGIDGVVRHKNGYSVSCASRYIAWTKDFFEACCARKSAELRLDYHPNHGR